MTEPNLPRAGPKVSGPGTSATGSSPAEPVPPTSADRVTLTATEIAAPTARDTDHSRPVSEAPTCPAEPAPRAAATPAGAKPKQPVRLGDFQLVRKLGQGGMGTVYLAQQVSLDRPVALKTLSRELADNPDLVQRFLREARAMARLQHPNIVQVYAADSVGGRHFAAIEYIDGQSMQAWMNQLQRLSVADALHVTLICAEALQHAHDQGMIHRDVKPDNTLVTRRGVVKVADFGLVKALDDDVSMTRTGQGMGTPLYMPPEQARDAKRVDRRTDVYALGTMLYYFLTGTHPFVGESTLEILLAKEQGRFTPARKLTPDIPDRLDLMIDKLIARDPDRRYANCEEIISAIESLNLAAPSLSFIDAPDKLALRRMSAGARAPSSTAPVPARKPAREQAAEATHVAEQIWHVKYANSAGRLTTAKMTTEQVRRGLRTGVLDLKTKAARSSQGDYLPLAQYAPFEQEMHGRAVQAKVDARARSLAGVYEQIDRDIRRRRRWRWLRRLTEGALGWFGLILWLAVLGAVGYGLYLVVPWLYDWVAARLNL